MLLRSLPTSFDSESTLVYKTETNSCTSGNSNCSEEQFGLPENVLRTFREQRNITDLYKWQKQCLSGSLLHGKNFLLALPTGAGKTLIAEVLILRELLVKRRNCILILPFVAIVQEEIASLLPFESTFGIFVEEYAASKGRVPPFKRRKSNTIYVCTIEKANLLVNSLIEHKRMDEIGLVVVDECHMLGESGGRGATMERCLTKVLRAGHCQIVGISATLSNVDDLCAFIHAEIFTTDFRPVKLQQRVKIGSFLYKIGDDGSYFNRVDLGENQLKKKDVDGISQLIGKYVPHKSVLIFCPTKKNSENMCQTLASIFPRSVSDHRLDERLALLDQIREENDDRLCPILEQTVRRGVAYHHSGLMQGERQHIEAAFKRGVICVICATSTLAAGVNLPARLVIIRSPFVGRLPIQKSQYLQMIGRAGRAGFDNCGDSITILQEGKEEETFFQMLRNPLDECRSGLTDESSLRSFCLELIFLGICKTKEDLMEVVESTLYGIQNKKDENFMFNFNAILHGLIVEHMVEPTSEDSVELKATEVGAATFNANFEPGLAVQIQRELIETLSRGIVLSSYFHLLFIIVPVGVEVNVDWNIFFSEFKRLSSSEKVLLATMGLRERNIVQNITRCATKNLGSDKATQVYIAFMMRQIWSDNTPVWEVAKRFGVDRGWMQSTLQATYTQASAIVRFSERIPSLWPLKYLLPEMVRSLSMCKNQELMPLLSVDCVKWSRAKALYSAGFKTVASLACAEPSRLIEALNGKLSIFQVQRIINSAKSTIRDQISEKAEELEEMGLTVSDIFGAQH